MLFAILWIVVGIALSLVVGYVLSKRSEFMLEANGGIKKKEFSEALATHASIELKKNAPFVKNENPIVIPDADALEEAYEKMKEIKEAYPNCPIEVSTTEDGHVTMKLRHADGNVVAVGDTNAFGATFKLARKLGV